MNRGINAPKLKADAAEAAAKGKHKRALENYLELERLEPKDGGWSRRAGEMYRQLGRVSDGIAAFRRAADKYADSGLVAKASAVCQTILRMRPGDADARARLDALMPARARPSVPPQPRHETTAEPRREELPPPAALLASPEPELRVRAGGSVPPPVPVEEVAEIEAELADELADFELRGEGGDPALERGDSDPRGLDRDALVEEVLATSSLFAPFEASEARALVGRFAIVEIAAGERIVEGRELTDRLTIVVRGEVAIAGASGEVRAPAPVFGSASLLARAPEPATAYAKTSCVALILPKASFREVIMTHPMLLAQLVED